MQVAVFNGFMILLLYFRSLKLVLGTTIWRTPLLLGSWMIERVHAWLDFNLIRLGCQGVCMGIPLFEGELSGLRGRTFTVKVGSLSSGV